MQQTATYEHKEYLMFSVNEVLFAFPAVDIEEVVRYVPITYIPGCHESVLGVIHLRGALESVLDTGRLLGLRPVKSNQTARIIITRNQAMRTGLLVDHVEDIFSLPEEALSEDLFSLPEYIRPFAKGYLTLESQRAVLLDMESLWKSVIGEESTHADLA
ncbi:MAG: chemotaxis protein CheW [Spirochaetota bacterium]